MARFEIALATTSSSHLTMRPSFPSRAASRTRRGVPAASAIGLSAMGSSHRPSRPRKASNSVCEWGGSGQGSARGGGTLGGDDLQGLAVSIRASAGDPARARGLLGQASPSSGISRGEGDGGFAGLHRGTEAFSEKRPPKWLGK
jgi:hypothetical protein